MLKSTLLILLLLSAVFAQPAPDSTRFGLKGGMGVFASSYEGLLAHVSLFVIDKNHAFSVRFVHAGEFMILGPKPVQFIQDIGILYGRQNSTNAFRFSYSAGLSIIKGSKRGNAFLYWDPGLLGSAHFNEIPFSTVGIPAELCLSFIYFKYVELSANLIGNLNADNSYFGGSLCLGIGKLR